jgi:hypothetical protein
MGIIDKDYGMPSLPDQEKFTIYMKTFDELPVDVQLEVLEYFINSSQDINLTIQHALLDLKEKLKQQLSVDDILHLVDYVCSDVLETYKTVIKEAFKKAKSKRYQIGEDNFIYDIK